MSAAHHDIIMTRQEVYMWKYDTLVRPPGTTVPDGLMFYRRCIFFFFLFRHSFSELPRPIALKLCHMVGIWLNFIIPLQKFEGAPPPKKKIGGQKHAKFRSILDHFRLIANISGTAEDIQNRPALQTMAIPPAFNEKLWSTNGLELHVSLDPLKMHFLAHYISALRGRCALKFLHALDIDQLLLTLISYTPFRYVRNVARDCARSKNQRFMKFIWT